MAHGGLSVFVCCVGMAVPLNRTRCKSPPLLFIGGGSELGNIATQPINLPIMNESNENKKDQEFVPLLERPNALSVVLQVLAVFCFLGALFSLLLFEKIEPLIASIILIGCLLTGVLLCALNLVVRACNKYLQQK